MFFKSLCKKTLCFLGFVCATQAATLRLGQVASDFQLTDDHGNMRTLAKCKGKKVALIFYPKDGSPYCTKQAKNIKEHFKKLTDQNIVVFGISSDDTKKHSEFKAKYELPFDLLTAPQEFIDTYGAGGWIFNSRVTILIDENGIIVAIIDKVDIQKHAQQILDGFEARK
jgi:peroxiredoxin Q/BCP